MELKDFLALPHPVEWDFVNEFSDKYRSLNDPLKKYFIYKLDNAESAYACGKKFKDDNPCWYELKDPDTQSNLLQSIYRVLWPNLVDKSFMRISETVICADTMNSVQTTLIEIMKDIDRENRILESLVPRIRRYSTNYSIALYAKTEKSGEFIKELLYFAGLENLIRYYHTIGNFVPVPYGFNSLRSMRTGDYWDLTLFRIYKWYMAVGDETAQNDELHNLLCKENSRKAPDLETAVISCKSWLTYFVTWQDFVEKNFLQDSVNISNGIYGKPKELWPEHFSGSLLPETKKQMEAFCTNASSRILARGNRMEIALKASKEDL